MDNINYTDKQLKEITERWEKTGLLAELKEEDKMYYALNYEKMKDILLHTALTTIKDEVNNLIEIIGFPIIRRLTNIKKDLDIKEVYIKLKHFIISNEKGNDESNYEYEMRLCKTFTKTYFN